MKQYVFYTLYLVIMIVLLGELAFFLLPSLDPPKPPPYDTAMIDEELGWRPKPNYHFEGAMHSLDNTAYPIKITTDEYGFRTRTIATDTARERVLIIGDSFTQAVEVSDDKTFYAHLESATSSAFYAHGMAGYGTLQELMILEEHLDRIDPTLVILQFCTNDFIDNELELEKTSKYHVGMRRPYLQDDFTIAYQSPLGRFEQLINKTNFLKF